MEKNDSKLTVAPTETKRKLRLNSESVSRLTVTEPADDASANTAGFNCSHPITVCT